MSGTNITNLGTTLRPANPINDKVMHDFIQKLINRGLQGIREEWSQVAGKFC